MSCASTVVKVKNLSFALSPLCFTLPLRQHGASSRLKSDVMPRSWLAVLLATHSTRAQSEAERTQQLLLKEAVDLQARNATGNGKFPLSTGAWFLTVR